MIEWTTDIVADRFAEASQTAHKLPAVRVQGYFSTWPAIVRTPYERMACEDVPIYRTPPTPAETARMLEVMRWVQWLEVEQRGLVWMRADNYEWHQIGKRFGYCRTTAWRHWKMAIQIIVVKLNDPPPKQESQRE